MGNENLSWFLSKKEDKFGRRLLVLTTQSLKLTLAREIPLSRTLHNFIGVATFTTLTALGAFVWIPLPFTPVPITLQTFFVLLGGAILGRRSGALSQLLYLGLGGLGLPIFAGVSGGLSRLVGPTGGYLIGFVLAAYLVGRMAEKKGTLWSLVLIMGVGEAIILLLGTLWLACLPYQQRNAFNGIGFLESNIWKG